MSDELSGMVRPTRSAGRQNNSAPRPTRANAPGSSARRFVGGEVANHHLKPIAAKVGWLIGMPEPSQVLERVRRVLDRNRRPVEDRQVLHRNCVPVFEAAIRNATAGQIPAPADQVDGLKRAKVGFREFVERVASAAGRRYQRKLLHNKVFRLTLELHERFERERSKAHLEEFGRPPNGLDRRSYPVACSRHSLPITPSRPEQPM